MSRLFVGNFGFEDELAGRRMPRTAWEATRGLCGCWAPLLEPMDQIVLGGCEGDSGVAEAAAKSTEIVPWGWSGPMVRLATGIGSQSAIPDPEVVEMLNRRRWAFGLEVDRGMAPPGTVLAENVDECASILSQPAPFGSGWMVKADLGASGRHQRRVNNGLGESGVLKWLNGCLSRDGLVIIEPVLESKGECGLQFELEAGERVGFRGSTELLTTKAGGYRGTRFGAFRDDAEEGELDELREMLDPVLAQVARSGYTGPLGIDSMRYQALNGKTCWRPLQDINARFTMGRCALEWAGRLPRGCSGTVLAVKWRDADTVDDLLEGLVGQLEGLKRAHRFSPMETPPESPTGLVLLVYESRVDPVSIEREVAMSVEGPAA